ncbi:MAG TPA: tripartite tricarboxylate transporter substrate binding protein [Casimicrobiaceae bacterium]
MTTLSFDPLRRRVLLGGTAALAAASLGVHAQGPAFPTRPLKMIIPYPPGGAGDIVGRLLGAKLAQVLGQPVVVDNRGGGAQVIATEMTAHAAPDGYTLFLCSTTHAINPALRKLPYDTLADFTPITLVARSPLVFVVHPSLGVSSIQELVAKAKQAPGRINYGSSGPGTGGHLSVELLKSMAGIDMVHVPYKGAAPALTDLLAGQVQLVCTSPLPAMPHVKAGRLRALALTSATRSPMWPELPTVAESGYPAYQSTLWYGLLAPAHLSPAIATTLHDAAVEALHAPDVEEHLRVQGAEAIGDTPQELEAFLREEIDRWTNVIRTAHITSTE